MPVIIRLAMSLLRLCCLRLRQALNVRLIRLSVLLAYVVFLFLFVGALVNRVDLANKIGSPDTNSLPNEIEKMSKGRISHRITRYLRYLRHTSFCMNISFSPEGHETDTWHVEFWH